MNYKSQESAIKLCNDYFWIASEGKYKATHGKERLGMLVHVCKVSATEYDPSSNSIFSKILNPK